MSGELVQDAVPADLRGKLEHARLDQLAFFRAIDQLRIDARDLPQPILHEMFDLDLVYAEALGALDEPRASVDVRAMLRDTRRALSRLAETRSRFLGSMAFTLRRALELQTARVRPTLAHEDAYHSIPGKDPRAGEPWHAPWEDD